MSDQTHSHSNRDQPAIYHIRVEGHLDAMWARRFENMTVTWEDNATTLLTGSVADQAMLYRILRQVRDLGMPLISVNRQDADGVNPDDPET